jgi:glyoxylase-like metal-dependent hydrolase (beta-lactamase superfamily II)
VIKYEIIRVTQFAQNCSLLWDTDNRDGVLIDPGGDFEKIKARLDFHGLKLKEIWLTHAHIDHVGAADELRQYYQVPIIGPEKGDKFWLDGLPTQAKMFGFHPLQAFTPTRWLEDGEKLSIGDFAFEVRHCPGHTPGHIVFYNSELKRVFVGDVLFVGSVGRTDFPKGSQADLMCSIKEKILSLPDDTGFIAGHGPEGMLGEERKHNPYLVGL